CGHQGRPDLPAYFAERPGTHCGPRHSVGPPWPHEPRSYGFHSRPSFSELLAARRWHCGPLEALSLPPRPPELAARHHRTPGPPRRIVGSSSLPCLHPSDGRIRPGVSPLPCSREPVPLEQCGRRRSLWQPPHLREIAGAPSDKPCWHRPSDGRREPLPPRSSTSESR